ncbi:MAG TPA: hypothetical protein VMC08_09100 [Bacteroidales bacterium]|nr:hypothetical protein [Bacteroidales bacterium]
MKTWKNILAIVLATIWISISEFVRNQFIVRNLWLEHYKKMGLVFPDKPINGAVWGLWSLLAALFVYMISRKFNLLQTAFLAWFGQFVLMWVVIGNLGVLPHGILWMAVPLSLLESFIAALIVKKTAS